MSGLKVNFCKSFFTGINIETDFMQKASRLLRCKSHSLPFKYLGLPIGANARKVSTWQLVIDCFKHQLEKWKRRFLTSGGKVVLINSVLTSLPLYYFSIFKVSKNFLRVLTSM